MIELLENGTIEALLFAVSIIIFLIIVIYLKKVW